MKTLVVYDSFFGNTEKVAQAIGSAIGSPDCVGVVRVSEFRPEMLKGIELLVVGSPTRAFRPSDATRTFLRDLSPEELNGVKIAAFDTRINPEETNSALLRFLVKIFGYAAKPISDQLAKKGGSPVAPPAGFYVNDTEGPLKDGELERAADWARQCGGE